MKQVLTNTRNSFENLESTFPKSVLPVQKRKINDVEFCIFE